MDKATSTTTREYSRNFSLTSYLPLEAVKEFCERDFIAHYAFILHDKDKTENGALKPPHYHINLRTKNALSYSGMRKKIDVFTTSFYLELDDDPQNTLLEITKDVDGAHRYLTHSTKQAISDGKYQYNESDVVSDDIGYWRGDYSRSSRNVAYDIITAIENGMRERDLLMTFGREYLINRAKYREFLYFMREEEKEDIRLVDEDTGEVEKILPPPTPERRRQKEGEIALEKLNTLEKGILKKE